MSVLRRIAVLGIVSVAALNAQLGLAQGVPGASYRPAQPTFSPWLNLYQRNSGPLDNYHTFVRPEMQLRATLRQQRTMLQDQGEGLRELSGQVSAVQQSRAPAHPTGAGSVFMDYEHYYDFTGSANRPRSAIQRPTSRASTRGF